MTETQRYRQDRANNRRSVRRASPPGDYGKVEFARGPRGFGLQGEQGLRLLANGWQGFGLLAKNGVIAALAVGPDRAFGGGFRERQSEQDFFVGGGHGTSWLGTSFSQRCLLCTLTSQLHHGIFLP